MKFQSLITLSEYKLCLNDGILDSGINNFQVTFFFRKYDTFLTYELYNIKIQFLNVSVSFYIPMIQFEAFRSNSY
jgi:hypothetical protein